MESAKAKKTAVGLDRKLDIINNWEHIFIPRTMNA